MAGLWALAVGFAAGCSDSGGDTPDTDTGGSDTPTGSVDAGKVHDAGDAGAVKHMALDAHVHTGGSLPGQTLSCEPGSYSGDFTCQIDGVLPWGGQIAFDLVEERMDGADVVFLEIKAGTKLSGMDTMNGTFGGDLQGMFDCDTGELTGTLANGFYNGNFGFMVKLAGGLSGQYSAGDGGTPGFSGVMGPLTNPDWGAVSPSAMCTWTAVRVGDATEDAGSP